MKNEYKSPEINIIQFDLDETDGKLCTLTSIPIITPGEPE